MRGVVPASSTELFKNERRELSSGIILETCVLADLVAGSVMFAGLLLTVAPPHDRQSLLRRALLVGLHAGDD
jgi:hypothetical protein